MSITSAAAVPLALAAWAHRGGAPHGPQVAVIIVLAIGVVLGELFPIEIARNGKRSDEVTVSSTLALALVIIAPLHWAVLAQAVPLIVDDLRRGKHWSRPVFNVAQYLIAFCAAKMMFIVAGGSAIEAAHRMLPHSLPAAFAAGGVFLLVNQVLVGTAVALSAGVSLKAQLREDGLFQLGTAGLLVALAPLVVVAAQYSLLLTPLLVLPLLAVGSTTRMAVQRQHDALHDVLTGLPNRAFLRQELTRQITLLSDVHLDKAVAILLLDLDHFKEINDTLGHQAGDQLIADVGSRLAEAAAARPLSKTAHLLTAERRSFVARLGGDEFAFVLTLDGPSELWEATLDETCCRIRDSLGATVVLADVRLTVQASMGVALAPQHGTTVDDLLARADVAMYAAKKGDQTWCLYNSESDTNSPERLALLTELRDSIGLDQLVLVYQPKCNAVTREVHSVEALVRWQHPTRGLLTPDMFIPMAESTGIISEVTYEVLRQALRQGRVWRDAGAALPVAVNVSARLLSDTHLSSRLRNMLLEHELPPDLLILEVTESTIMNDPARALSNLAQLRHLGVRLAIDDYGTGYSSLTYLRQLDADELKIDRSFISALQSPSSGICASTMPSDHVIVRSTIEMGRALGMAVVAEGVETEETWRLLHGMGCDLVQGYVITQPLSAGAFDAWRTAWSPNSGPTKGPGRRKSIADRAFNTSDCRCAGALDESVGTMRARDWLPC
jgi:diguanylate cyclase (GGDEF)-like protein